MHNKLEGLIFDLDDTLYPYKVNHERALQKTISDLEKKTGIPETTLKEAYLQGRDDTKKSLGKTASSHNRLLYFQRMSESLNLNSLDFGSHLYELYWSTYLERMDLFPGALSFLKEMKGMKKVLLTDLTSDIQFKKVKKLGLENYFDFIITSEEVGVDKPDPKMFQKALEKMNCQKDEVIVLGDNFEKDILGANRSEINALWFNPEKRPYPQGKEVPSFQNYEELKEKIDALRSRRGNQSPHKNL